jgi:hypothetical protein
VLTGLIWSWIDHLKEPVLREQEIIILFKNLEHHRGSSREYGKYENRLLNWKELDKVNFSKKKLYLNLSRLIQFNFCLKKGTFYTLNYMAEIVNKLMPLEDKLLDKLIAQFINCFTHTHTHDTESKFREMRVEENHVLLLNTKNMMSKEKYTMLYHAIKDLIEKPFVLVKPQHGTEKKTTASSEHHEDRHHAVKKSNSHYANVADYAEEILDDEYEVEHLAAAARARSSGPKKPNNF